MNSLGLFYCGRLCHDYAHSVSKGHLGRHRTSFKVKGFQVVLFIHSSELKLHCGDCRMKNCTFFWLFLSTYSEFVSSQS